MKIFNFIFNCKENFKEIKNFFVTISKEMVTVLWVVLVLLLIIWSYIESENNITTSTELNMYQISISDALKID